MDFETMAQAFGEIERHPITPQVMVVGKELWDQLGLTSTEMVEFDGFIHRIHRGVKGVILLPVAEITV